MPSLAAPRPARAILPGVRRVATMAVCTVLITVSATACATPQAHTAAPLTNTSTTISATAAAPAPAPTVQHAFVDVDGHKVFYREAGPADAPTVLLLHGFPSASHLFRELIPKLATRYHVIAPDIPGFGLTEVKADASFQYSFDQLTQVVDRFTEIKKIDRYAMYVFDIGAPIGWRLAVAHPERITAIVSQNGNAYEEGLSANWAGIRKYWADPSPQTRDPLRSLFTLETTRWQYYEGVKEPSRVAPDGYLLDQQFLNRAGQEDIQLAILLDYRTNLLQYPAVHAYFRRYQPPLLAVWGASDPFFLPVGAQAFKRDLPKAEIHMIDGTGHFALASHGDEIAGLMLAFLGRHLNGRPH
ncbi:Pimeloyl-ACP methyl ester carboxylesterase [Roseateles sp. YR242]|uniref:alpha/beta fold hydrolase n=1 Tax=Roseateles sp. YR242 TaxID=1855305 RepID=UPI0008CEE332|nr:alpha/beta hydrolase [Roseateles sp. YR242]SEK34968.1 Pimeloyl-ACP methyl ester carboxylesterase [Roseateles sp. YR242]